jgi:hypothetical protein
MEITVTYERPWGTGWIAAEPPAMQRASHALVHDGGVWLVDPVAGEGLEEILGPLGELRGVLQLLDRHNRDGRVIAARHRVPLHRVPFDGIPEAPFEVIPLVRRRKWEEVALWWPARRALVVPEALGTSAFFALPGQRLGVHALLRPTPPRALLGRPARHVLVGHGPSIVDDDQAEGLVATAIARSRRDIPRMALRLPRLMLRGGAG